MKFLGKIPVNQVIKILLSFLFMVNVAGSLYGPLFAVFITGSIIGGTLKTVGFAASIGLIVKSIFQVPLARRIDKKKGELDDFIVMLIGAGLGIIYLFGLMLVRTEFALYVLSALDGLGAAFLMAAYYGIFSRHIDKGSEGFEWSLFSAGSLTASGAIGAAIGGILTEAIGFRLTFLVAAGLYIFATVILTFIYPQLDGYRRGRVPPAEA